MNPNLLMAIVFLLFGWASCGGQTRGAPGNTGFQRVPVPEANPFPSIRAIPVPAGYQRVVEAKLSFAEWLRGVALKKNRMVYLYNGEPKHNQQAQFAVLDISTGNKDLQQCADAVMRLRAEYLYSLGDPGRIDFHTVGGASLNFGEWAAGKRWRLAGGRLVGYTTGAVIRRAAAGSEEPGLSGQARAAGSVRIDQALATVYKDRKCFDEYLETVFSWCSTLSLEKELNRVERFSGMQIGDVFIKGGSPGHAMLVVDMAEDRAGHKLYMLAQGYMPAQDIHIVKNPSEPGLSPWYRLEEGPVDTPEWTFYPGQLRSWRQ
ncbi:MAG TPA: DUF4846 domain-containing protein [Puia sp.]|nr:DUF4846 domain-containing protein [Puia sp.]